MVEYWAGSGPVARVDGADVVFPALITAAIVEGDPGTLDLVPTRGVCCVKWTVQSDRSAVSVVRFTEIPETGPVVFGALQQVDPATFVPTPVTPTLIETIDAQVNALAVPNTADGRTALAGSPELSAAFVAVRTSDGHTLPPSTIVVITLDKTLAQITASPVADIADITFEEV